MAENPVKLTTNKHSNDRQQKERKHYKITICMLQ